MEGGTNGRMSVVSHGRPIPPYKMAVMAHGSYAVRVKYDYGDYNGQDNDGISS